MTQRATDTVTPGWYLWALQEEEGHWQSSCDRITHDYDQSEQGVTWEQWVGMMLYDAANGGGISTGTGATVAETVTPLRRFTPEGQSYEDTLGWFGNGDRRPVIIGTQPVAEGTTLPSTYPEGWGDYYEDDDERQSAWADGVGIGSTRWQVWLIAAETFDR